MSLSIAKALLDCGGDYDNLGELAVKVMREVGRPYPNCGYGGMFRQWMYGGDPKPYNSFGNGAAMRVSDCPFRGIRRNSVSSGCVACKPPAS
jgi:type I restriction enzyme M protein